MFVPLVIVTAALAWIAARALHSGPEPSKLPYAQLVQAVKERRIHNVDFEPEKHQIDATFIDGEKAAVDYPTDQVVTRFQRLLRGDHIPFATRGDGSP